MTDQVDEAIAATEGHQQVSLNIALPPRGPGFPQRPAVLTIPADLDIEEAMGLVSIIPKVLGQLRQAKAVHQSTVVIDTPQGPVRLGRA